MSMTMSLADRPPQARRAPSRRSAGVMAWFKRKAQARPWSTVAHLAFGLLAALAVVNALWWQAGEGAPERGAPAPAATPASPPPAPPARPADLAASGPAIAPLAAAPRPVAAAPTAAAAPAAARPTPPRDVPVADPIGDLIRTGQPTPARGESRTAEARPAETRPVVAAQRALNRLGYGPIRADGVFGEATRAALERFERDRRLPVTRDLSARTLRELASVSGQRLD
jgi:hypothetical protein